MVEQAIQMALLPSAIYHKMQKAFLMFEDGTLKGQKARVMTGVTLQKALEGKLAPKLSQFKVFQGLKVIITSQLYYKMCTSSSAILRMRTNITYWMVCSTIP